jgi:hypothetical protein
MMARRIPLPVVAPLKQTLSSLEARGGIEPPIKVLQTFALPLGDRASDANSFYQTETPASPFHKRTAIPGLQA